MRTYEEAMEHQAKQYSKGKKDGLRGMETMMEKLGHPERNLKFIHVTGTNGKGSTSTMMASVLYHAGYKTGLYISPFVDDFRERIQINGEMIAQEDYAAVYDQVAEAAQELEQSGRPYPSEFEITTCCALLYFSQQGCQIVVLEVGIGGAKDATNIVRNTEAAVFTPISLDHTAMLGNTPAEIAAEKSGILKPGCDAVTCWDQDPGALEALNDACTKMNVTLHQARRPEKAESALAGNRIWWDGQELYVAFPGEYQVQNASLALSVLEVLQKRGYSISAQAIKEGMEAARFNARLEAICHDPLVILDGSHNPAGVKVLTDYIKNQLKGQKVTLVLAMLADKTHGPCIEALSSVADRVVAVAIDYHRALASEVVAEEARKCCSNVMDMGTVEKGMVWALEHAEGPVVVCGSLYLPGLARKIFMKWKETKEVKQHD